MGDFAAPTCRYCGADPEPPGPFDGDREPVGSRRYEFYTCGSKEDWNSYEHTAGLDCRASVARDRQRFREALERIAGEDYRGNRPHSATVAWKALHPDD